MLALFSHPPESAEDLFKDSKKRGQTLSNSGIVRTDDDANVANIFIESERHYFRFTVFIIFDISNVTVR